MSIYSPAAASAARMIARFGQAVTITSRSDGSYNPATGSATVTSGTRTGSAAIFDVKTKDIDGTLILDGDKIAYLSPSFSGSDQSAPNVDDSLTDVNGIVYAIKRVTELAPGGPAVMYELQLRA